MGYPKGYPTGIGWKQGHRGTGFCCLGNQLPFPASPQRGLVMVYIGGYGSSVRVYLAVNPLIVEPNPCVDDTSNTIASIF